MTQWSSSGGSKAQTGTLTWNSNGTLGQLQMSDTFNTADNGMTCTHSYDDLARLASANCGNSIWVQNFSYDPYGNITKTVPTGATGLSFTNGYGSGNHVSGYTYDAMGNVTNDGSHPFAYDAEGRPTTAGSKTILYDAFNRAVSVTGGSSTTEILYDIQGRKFGFMNGQSVTSYFVPLVGGVQAVFTSSGLKYYRHADWLGTSRLALNTSGVLYGARAFAPYGEAFAEAGTTDRVFTGQTQDSIPGQNGYFDFLFRQQSAAQGRWMVPDPAGTAAVDPSNPQTWNRYAYVANNPLSNVDPLGLNCVTYAGITGDDGIGEPCNDMTPPTGTPDATVCSDGMPDWTCLAFQGMGGFGAGWSTFVSNNCSFGGCANNNASGGGGGKSGKAPSVGVAANNGPSNVSCNSTTGICVPSSIMEPRPAGCGAAIAQGAFSFGLDVVGVIPGFGNAVSATAAGARAVNGIVAYGGAAYGIATGVPDENPFGAASAGAALGLTIADAALEGGKVIPALGNALSATIGLYDGYQLAKTIKRCW